MTSAIKSREWMPALLLASLYFCLAGRALAAPVSFSFTSSSAPVYDLTGSYGFDQQIVLAGGVSVRLSLSLSVKQDSAGRLQGSGLTTVRIGNDSYPATYIVSGRVSGGGRVTRAALVARLRGQQDAGGAADPSFSVSVRYNLDVSPAGLTGRARGSAQSAKLGRGGIRSSISGVPLPAGVDGSWSVQMNIVPLGGSSGTGSINLPNGRSLQASVTGGFTTVSGLNRIRLLGANLDRGNTLNISFTPQPSSLQKLSGRILGQTVTEAATPSGLIGSQACLECHGAIKPTTMNRLHGQIGVQCESCHGPAADHAANYYDPLVRPKVDLTGPVCGTCHYGGLEQTTTNTLHAQVGVQCENCHGPATDHAANITDPLTRLKVDLTGPACGTCHSGTSHPTYEEWSVSDHASLVEDIVLTNRTDNCGWCHSGSVRVSLLDALRLPAGGENVPIGCPTCHETHQPAVNPALLRNPVASTNDYSLSVSDDFTNQYNPAINLCGQCHNRRGASWTDTAEAPHFSPQYNFLLGSIGELATGSATNNPGTHAGLPASAQYSLSGTFYLTNQCVSCHMQNDAAPANIPSHTFKVDTYDVCLNCHVFDPQLLVQLVAVPAISNRVYQLKYGLDLWANTRAPASLRANGMLAWEYTNPGGLIWQTNQGAVGWRVADQVNFQGPDAAGQMLIPDNIKKARFNLYLVLRDGSFGVHNPNFAVDLLETAASWVSQELNN